MIGPFTRAPHQGGVASGVSDSPHAALLIDFDNVTMGMRSDLSKELKTLLGSDVIKGKVSVQRAYADWRRYPQYIVPLSEASVDLIFAPAYGSNKKNATDIRMAIDAVELVFTRPEIGTYILLTGDSDFSSLVLKLKEYGKYVIGVGIQESTSDILVQNCDEYYSYTTLSGLKKTTEADQRAQDPWVLVKDALKRMSERDDVMRSDRLKQVMQEIDPTFDESGLGFSKFSKFLTEASSRGLVKLHKLDNGQYEVSTGGRGRRDDGEEREPRRERGRGRSERRERGPRGRGTAEEAASTPTAQVEAYEASQSDEAAAEDPLRAAYGLMTRSLEELRDAGRDPVRDSDVKRKMLEIDGSFDEAELGFSKFSKFLSQAEDHDVIRLLKTEAGNYEVTLADGRGAPRPRSDRVPAPDGPQERGGGPKASDEEQSAPAAAEGGEPSRSGPAIIDIDPSEVEEVGRRLGPRRGSTRRRHDDDEGPSLFAGQVVSAPPSGTAEGGADSDADVVAAEAADFDAGELGLPTDPDAIARYLTHRYRGVGEKTAESLVERFGTGLFRVLRDDPEAIREAVTPKRAEQVLEAWETDYERRIGRRGGGNGGSGESRSERGGRRGGRRRGSRGRSES